MRSHIPALAKGSLVILLCGCLFALAGCTAESNPSPTVSQPTATTFNVPTSGAATQPAAPADSAGLNLPPGYRADLVVEGLNAPTQMIRGTDNTLWVAQLAGGENAGQGQIVSIALDQGTRRTLVEGLDKPTGIAIVGDDLWIAAGRTLLRAPITNNDPPEIGTPEIILENLPTNGRSNGTLTVTPDGELLYETSGARSGNSAAADSGTLWALDPATNESRVVATGLKNAYAHAYDSEGRLWTTDVADDAVNDGAPPDELNLVVEGANFGWPQCFGVREPARNLGGDETICAATRPSVATFPPHATPVGLVASPWETNAMLVANWAGPKPAVYLVAYTFNEDNATSVGVAPFIEGLARPQHLLLWEDAALLVSDHETGRVYRVVASE